MQSWPGIHRMALATIAALVGCGGDRDPRPGSARQSENSGDGATSFYVSPGPEGNDGNLGTEDAPFQTIGRARDAVRAIAGNMSNDVVVYLRGGIYPLSDTLHFDQGDSGQNGFNVIY